MVSNINLSSPEISEKKSISGKSALMLSAVLIAVVFAVYLTLFFLKSMYTNNDKATAEQITQEQAKINGVAFSDIFDFQDRLNLAGKALDDHGYWDNMTKRMSAYVIPEVRFTKLAGKKDPTGTGSIDISGVAQNLDALSRELILLKDLPNLDSMEFKNAGAVAAQSGEPGGISFDASLKINKTSFQK